MTTGEHQLAVLLRHAADRAGPPRNDVIEASITVGRRRQRQRRTRNLVAVAVAAAVGASAATYTVGRLGDDGPNDPTSLQSPRPISGFGVRPDRMGETLAGLLPTGARAQPAAGEVPASVVTVLTDLGYPNGALGPILRYGIAEIDAQATGVQVAVLVRRDAGDAATVQDDCDLSRPDSGTGSVCSRTAAGPLLLQFADSSERRGAALATLSAGNGWLVQVVTTDVDVVPAATLTQVALDDLWLR